MENNTSFTQTKHAMKQHKDEAEVIVRLDALDGMAHITVHAWTSMANKMERLYGTSLDGVSQQSRRWQVPLKNISFRRILTAAKRTMSPERKAALAAGLAAGRAKKAA